MEFYEKHFDSIDSTNTWAKHNAHLLPRDKITLVTASSQTDGRGRSNRTWFSPKGNNIYATFCFFIEKHRLDIGNIPQVLALSAANVLEKLGFTPTLKWPNDILLQGKKVAGILTETTSLSDMICVILGIGLNVNMTKEQLLQINCPATSLFAEQGSTYNVADILSDLKYTFKLNLERFIEEGFYIFLEEYRRHMPVDPNRIIRFNDNRKIWEGTIHAINDDGSLSLRLNNGEIRTFLVGEIQW